MLDDIELDGLGQLNTVAGYFLGSAVVILVIGLGVGITMWIAGRKTGSNLATKGLVTSGLAVLGAVILGGAGGAVQWGSGLGNSALMPQAARQQDMTIEKEAASVTCKTVTKSYLDEGSSGALAESPEALAAMFDSHDESLAFVKALVGPDYQDSAPIRALASSNPLQSVSWHPDGESGDCAATNQTVADCTTVKLKPFLDTGDTYRTDIRIGGADCEA